MGTYRVMPVTTSDYRRLSEKRLPRFLFDYIDGGAGEEHSLADNVDDFRRFRLRQRVLQGELAQDPQRLRSAAMESINVLASLSLPAGFGFALVANDFVPLVLGDQWTPIVSLLTILVPYLGIVFGILHEYRGQL